METLDLQSPLPFGVHRASDSSNTVSSIRTPSGLHCLSAFTALPTEYLDHRLLDLAFLVSIAFRRSPRFRLEKPSVEAEESAAPSPLPFGVHRASDSDGRLGN